MPGPVLHISIARRLGADVTDAGECASLIAGAIGPDIGLFPGACRRISDLSHHGRPGALAEELFRNAATKEEELYARGWLSHCFADIAIHPFINAITGSLPDDDMRAHTRVELGFDAYLFNRLNAPLEVEITDAFAPYLHRCYAKVYGEVGPKSDFVHAYRSAAAIIPKLVALASLHAFFWGLGPFPVSATKLFLTEFLPLKLATLVAGDRVRHSEFAQPEKPTEEQAGQVISLLDESVSRAGIFRPGDPLDNIDLDSGERICAHPSG